MTDKTEAMDNLIAQDADLIEICPDDLVRRLRSNRPLITLPHEAADRIEAQAAEIERISSQRDAYLDGYKKAFADVVKLHDALRNIQIEAEREQGSWVHLKRVIALNCKQTLAALEARGLEIREKGQ